MFWNLLSKNLTTEHEDTPKEFELAKHLRENLNHKFKWETLLQAPKGYQPRKILKIVL